MSNEFLKAADDAKRLLKGFAAVATVADAFERVGQLQQAQGEAEAALATLHGQINQARGELETLGAAAVSTKAEAEQMISDARWNADDKARSIVNAAKAKAADIEAKAEQLLADAKEKAIAAEETAQSLAIDADLKRQELADLEAKINEARANIAKLLGT